MKHSKCVVKHSLVQHGGWMKSVTTCQTTSFNWRKSIIMYHIPRIDSYRAVGEVHYEKRMCTGLSHKGKARKIEKK